MEELRASIAYEDAPEAERDYAAAFAALPRISGVVLPDRLGNLPLGPAKVQEFGDRRHVDPLGAGPLDRLNKKIEGYESGLLRREKELGGTR